MKPFSIFSLSVYQIAIIKCDWQKMNQDYNDLVYQKVEALANNTDLYDFSEDFESIVKKLTTVDLSIVENYGCYCNFNDKHLKGGGGGVGGSSRDTFRTMSKGKPLDDVDRFCKILHDGYTCAQVDEPENNCIPWEVEYQSAFNNGLYHDLRMDQLNYLCEKSNGKNTCSTKACKIEGWFVQSFFSYYATGGDVDLSKLKHSNGFKHKKNCFGKVKKLEEVNCCNTYPVRYPFKNKEGNVKCCGSTTYNVFTHSCCDDKFIKNDCSDDNIISPVLGSPILKDEENEDKKIENVEKLINVVKL